ncbi:MAG: peptidyl-prolyl cis-trans isomerase [Candidatus Sabulitectum sp.]|nr:peptidyl-prolyl cis-trans isomerase [Candidatus Sabulitectum sp.]
MHKYIFLFAFLLIQTGCGSPDGNTWLIRTSTDSISVSEVGNIWKQLDQSARMRFLAKDNPVGDFITALGGKTMITAEIDNENYLHSQYIQSMKNCWIINSAFIAYSDTLSSYVLSSITDTDLSHYGELLGSIVWYSSPVTGSAGPARLPDLPWNLAFALDSIAPGSHVEVDGVMYTLDSIEISSQEMVDATLADTSTFNTFARSSLAESRSIRNLDSLKREVMETFQMDSNAVAAYCLQRESVDSSTELASWNGGSISAGEFHGIADFASMGHPGNPQSFSWVSHNLQNQARLSFVADLYAAEFPQGYTSFTPGAEAFALDQASELLFQVNVADAVQFSDSLVYQAYLQMDSVPQLPETRVFESVMVPGGILEEAIALMSDENSLVEIGYPGYTEFLDPGNEFLSRPVVQHELPYEIDLALFAMEESSHEWSRPVEVEEDLFVFFRLVEIIPPQAASFEQVEATIRRNLRIHLEEQRTMDWMCELEAIHEFQVNHGILSDLPTDPAGWSEL